MPTLRNWVIGGGIVALVGGAVYAMTRKKKDDVRYLTPEQLEEERAIAKHREEYYKKYAPITDEAMWEYYAPGIIMPEVKPEGPQEPATMWDKLTSRLAPIDVRADLPTAFAEGPDVRAELATIEFPVEQQASVTAPNMQTTSSMGATDASKDSENLFGTVFGIKDGNMGSLESETEMDRISGK